MESKPYETIKNRMLKTAAKIWGVSINEIETSFDPVVSLLISSCASEISKIQSRLNESENKVTEKLIELMTPETTYDSKPAHAIMYVNPQDDYVNLNADYLFYYKRKQAKNNTVNLQNIFFSPVQDFKVIRAAAKFLICGNEFKTLGQGDNQIQKRLKIKEADTAHSAMFLGIESDLNNLNLEDVSLYFSCNDVDDADLFFHYLKYSKWSVNGRDLITSSGFYNSDESLKSDISSIFDYSSDKSYFISKQTLNYYQRFYVTIKTKTDFDYPKQFNEVEELLSANGIKTDPNITWIKIVFPEEMSFKTLQSVSISLNAAPVLNKELKSFSYQMRSAINIIPVNSEGYFFDIKSINNTSGKSYQLKTKNINAGTKGTYYVRDKSIGKLDYRSAKEYLIHLMELLKDESASFSFMNHDFLHTNINSLNQQISLIEDKLSKSEIDFSDKKYIFLEPFGSKEVLLIEYWSTNGEDANGLKPGSNLEVYKALGVKQQGNYLITSTFEGKSNLNLEERLNAYRSSLLSRDRIVTTKDIEALCFDLYKDKITKVAVSRTYKNNTELNKGLTPCILIELTANNSKNINSKEWELLNTHLHLNLKQRSMNVFPYVIEII